MTVHIPALDDVVQKVQDVLLVLDMEFSHLDAKVKFQFYCLLLLVKSNFPPNSKPADLKVVL